MLTIKFKKNSSPKFDEVELNARKFNNFTQNGDIYSIDINEKELKGKKNLIKGITSHIWSWDGTEFILNNKKVPYSEIDQLIQTVICESSTQDKSNCKSEEGWNCKHINSILKDKTGASSNWYEYGRFDGDTWIVDKEAITHKLLNEIDKKHLETCSNFSKEELLREIDNLPNSINPKLDPNWDYKRKASTFGSMNQEIIGVEPKKEQNRNQPLPDMDPLKGLANLFGLGDNPLSGLFDSLNNLDPDSFGTGSWSGMGGDGMGEFFSGLFGDMSSSSSNSSTPKNKSGRSIPNVTFNEIGGMDNIIKQVKEVVELPIVAPDLLDYYKIKPHKGILLYGPPGCGKTLLAKATANEINAHFIPISGPEILNKYLGQSEENLRNIFNEAINKAPSIIYFDEFDSLAAHRNQELDPYNSRVVNQILTLLDGMDDNAKVCVMASTNRIDIIDEAIKRPGRFDYILEVSKPDLEGCRQIFNIYTEKMPLDENFDKDQFVSKYLNGSTGAEIAFIATEAAYNSMRRTTNIDNILHGSRPALNSSNVIIEEDFLKAIEALNKNRKGN